MGSEDLLYGPTRLKTLRRSVGLSLRVFSWSAGVHCWGLCPGDAQCRRLEKRKGSGDVFNKPSSYTFIPSLLHVITFIYFYYFIITFRMHFLYLWMLDLLFWRFARFSENRTWILSSQFCANDATSSHLYMCIKMESSQNDLNGVALNNNPKKKWMIKFSQ